MRSESDNICAPIPCQVHNKSRVLADLPSLTRAELVEYELGWLERAVSIVVRNPHARGTETDNVATHVTSKVGNITRVPVNPPSLIGSEIFDDEIDRTEFIVALVQRGRDPPCTAAYDVHPAVACQVGNKARVLLNTPVASAVAEVVDDGRPGGKCAVTQIAGDEDMCLTESYDIGKTVSCGVAKEAEVAIEAPTPSIVTEVVERDVDGFEVGLAIVPGNENSTIPKSNDIASSHASNIRKVTEVLLDSPGTSTVAEIGENEFNRFGEGIVPVVEGGEDAKVPKTDEVTSFVASDVADETDVFIDVPHSCVEPKVVDGVSGPDANVVAHDHDSILTKPNDIPKA